MAFTVAPSRVAAAGDRPAAVALDSRSAEVGSYYLRQRHGLVHRHLEKVTIASDQTARWQLTINLELPVDESARCAVNDGQCQFLFPLMFKKKGEGRTGFDARFEDGTTLSLPTRTTCNRISAVAAARAAAELNDELCEADPGAPRLPEADLRYAFLCIATERPYGASVILNELLRALDPRLRDRWDSAGLTTTLKMLVEHSLAWAPIRGLPGEHRQIEVSQDVELLPRPFRRWRFGPLEKTGIWRLLSLQSRRLKDPGAVLDTGRGRKYGKIGRRISFSVLGERLALPLGWLPIELDFPTIYARRCLSYHFELVCPNGLSPRGIKLATDDGRQRKGARLEGGETLGTQSGRLYLPGGRNYGDLTVRATMGIGRGVFPFLWLLMGTITAVMLWGLVAANPTWLIDNPQNSQNEIAAGILLGVPALLGALVLGFEGSITRMLGGARILLLTAGLASAAAAAVLIGSTPLDYHARAMWTACAVIATAATVPLATSWLLSLPLVWRSLGKLSDVERQYSAMVVLLTISTGIVLVETHLSPDRFDRGALAVLLMVMTVPLILLASNRFSVPLASKRYFISVGLALAAFVCLLTGCAELRRAVDPGADYYETAERLAVVLLPASLFLGGLLSLFTWPAREGKREVHVAPAVLKAAVAGRRTPELRRLRPGPRQSPIALPVPLGDVDGVPAEFLQIDHPVQEEPVGDTEADWSWGVRSTVDLPAYAEGEFERFIEGSPGSGEEEDALALAGSEREALKLRMDALREGR